MTSTMTKPNGWTGGPWRWSDSYVTEDGRHTWSLLGADGYGILACDGDGNSPQGIYDPENANLIASAPSLYEALAAVLPYAAKYLDELDSNIVKARAALSAAEGGA
jgi:hypothetical protein